MNGLGSVSVDIHKKEREFEHLTLSDESVVKYLILNRSKLDVGYGANTNININQAGDIFDFNQEIIVMYSSLDKVIEKSALTKKQKILIDKLFEGNNLNDASKILEINRDAVYKMLDRITSKIVTTNNEIWYYTMGHNGYIVK